MAAQARVNASKVLGASCAERWVTLVRWIDAARRGQLFGVAGLGDLGRRRDAEHVVLALAARGGRTLGADLAESGFGGAVIAA